MAINFPDSPTTNDLFTSGGKTWEYDGTAWTIKAVATSIATGSITYDKLASDAVTTVKIADGAITAAKIADGTVVAAEIASSAITTVKINDLAVTTGKINDSAVTTAKILDSNVTTAKINDAAVTTAKVNDSAVTTAKINDAAVTQAKLGTTLSAVTVTTAANRDTAVASPFTGQLVFLTDTKKIQVWDGTSWLNITLAPPETPTSLSATALSTTSVSVAFTAGGANGSPITNYKYALSTDSGSTYGSFTALDPADTTTPITISSLTQNTAYYIKLKAVNDMGDSVASAAVSVTTLDAFSVDYLVVAGGGSGGGAAGGGGGAGGLRSSVTATGGGGTLESSLNTNFATNYAVAIGAGGALVAANDEGNNGTNSSFSTITSVGGGGGGRPAGASGGSGRNGGSGGGNYGDSYPESVPTANQGFKGALGESTNQWHGGGGGAGAVGVTAVYGSVKGAGGAGVATSITGSSVTYGGGGGGGTGNAGFGAGAAAAGGSGGGGAGSTNDSGVIQLAAIAGTANRGGGGGGASGGGSNASAAGGSGIVILRYPVARTITIGAGLTGSTATDGSYKVTTITAGTGNVSWA